MGIRLLLFYQNKIDISYSDKKSSFILWRSSYRPPFHTVFQILELIAVLIYMFGVLAPVQSEAQILRNVFKNIFFLEKHESPVSKASDLNEYYQYLQQGAETIHDDSIMMAKFPNESTLVYHTILYSNGSISSKTDPNVDPESLKNITTIQSSVPIYLFSDRKAVLSCSIWELVITVSDKTSSPAFFLSSKLYWHKCPLDSNGTVLGESIVRNQLEFYRLTVHSIIPLFTAALLHLIYVLYQIYVRMKLHYNWRKSDVVYQDLKSPQQFHYSIGFWIPCEMISCISLIISTIIVYSDSRTMTEYPTLLVMQIFALSAIPIFLTTLQWFRFNAYTYHYVAILREGCIQLFAVAISFLPVILAFFFAGILMFATIAPKTRSYFSMLTILVSFTLGDNILPVYNEFTDGTSVFNWVSFVYVTLLVLVSGWVVFASFTAMISFLDQKILMKQKLHKD